jgi:hypothetical protein
VLGALGHNLGRDVLTCWSVLLMSARLARRLVDRLGELPPTEMFVVCGCNWPVAAQCGSSDQTLARWNLSLVKKLTKK